MPEPTSAPRLPDPPREFLAALSDVSDRAAAGYGWQHGYLAGLAAAGAAGPAGAPFDLVQTPAALAKLYVLAALDEIREAARRIGDDYTAELSGPKPFQQLLQATQTHDERAAGQRWARRKDT